MKQELLVCFFSFNFSFESCKKNEKISKAKVDKYYYLENLFVCVCVQVWYIYFKMNETLVITEMKHEVYGYLLPVPYL